MEENYIPEKTSLMFKDEHGIPNLLNYHIDSKKPSLEFTHIGNEKYRGAQFNFTTERHNKETIQNAWKEILELDKESKLNLDTLVETNIKYFKK